MSDSLSLISEIGSILTGLATIGLAIIIFFQNRSLQKQTNLAYLPYITPRFRYLGQVPQLILENVGNGSAVEVYINIIVEGSVIEVIERYAFQKGEIHETNIDLSANPIITLSGDYRDIAGQKHHFARKYDYPPDTLD